MAQVINTGGSDSGAGVAVGVLIALVLAALVYFFVVRDGSIGKSDGPDINISAPSAPATPGSK
jgi:hypothetical protein